MDERAYKRAAKKFGISVDELKEEIQKAINNAYENPNPAALCIPRKGAVPTVEELVEFYINLHK